MPTVSGTLNAVYTDAARNKYALASGNLGALSYVSYFRVGMGGWLPNGTPRTPDPTLTDLDIILDQSRSPGDKRYPLLTNPPYTALYFQKAVGSMSVISGSNQLYAPCSLTTAEYNSDGVGSPVLWEIGLFDTSDVMLVYGTFSGITKDATKSVAFPNFLVF